MSQTHTVRSTLPENNLFRATCARVCVHVSHVKNTQCFGASPYVRGREREREKGEERERARAPQERRPCHGAEVVDIFYGENIL
jgi:hypothetical protein